eukprot:g6729.t1
MSCNAPTVVRKSLDSVFRHITRPGPSRGDTATNPSKTFVEERLQLISVIGRGSFATVWTGDYLEDTLAVKVLHSCSEGADESCETVRSLEDEIIKEANVIEQKRSKHIVRLIHYSPEKKWLVMELCKNGSLYDVMHDETKKEIVEDWSNRLRWATSVALGMNVVHNEPPTVLHRDLKPSNIFLDEHFEAKVGDFGLSKQLRNDADNNISRSLSNIRMVWQAPEVMQRREYSTKSDVYSFGVVLHQMLMLEGPYGFSSTRSYIDMMIETHVLNGNGLVVPEDRSALPGKWHDCLEAYITLMHRCCEENPDDRPDFGEISKTLLGIQTEYNRAMKAEVLKTPYITNRLVSKSFISLALFFCFVALVLFCAVYCIEKWGSENNEWGKKAKCTAFVFGLLGLLMIVASIISVALLYGRHTFEFLKQCLSQDGSLTSGGRSQTWRWNEYGPGAQSLSFKSPFERGEVAIGQAIMESDDSVVNLPIPPPEIWIEIREAFIRELEGNPMFQKIVRFCQDHDKDSLQQSEWATFIKVSYAEDKVFETAVWNRYRDYLSIRMFDPRASFRSMAPSFSSLDLSDSPLEGPSCFARGPSTSNVHSSHRLMSKSASFSFDRCSEKKMQPFGDRNYPTKTVSVGVPAASSGPLISLPEAPPELD